MTTPDHDAPAPQVTVVIVTYQGAHLLPECLESLREQRIENTKVRVVVVDNASTDGTAELVRERYEWVDLIENSRNDGFAGGNNIALRDVSTPWVLLLNNDARPRADFLRRMLDAVATATAHNVAALTATVLLADRFRLAGPLDPDTSLVPSPAGPLIADPRGKLQLVNSTGNLVSRDGYGHDRGWLQRYSEHRPAKDVFGFCGAAALLRTDALTEVGLFDESFFMYYEDTDLSWRMRRAGWNIEHVQDAVVEHLHAATSIEGSELFLMHNDRNRLLTLVKNASAGLVLRSIARTVLTLGSTTLRRNEPWSRTQLRWTAFWGFLRRLAPALRQRWFASAPIRRTRREVERDLVVSEAARTTPGR